MPPPPTMSPDLNTEIKRLNRLRLLGSYLLVPVILTVALFSARHEDGGWLARGSGAVLLTAGVALRFWALRTIDGKKKRLLVTWGPYEHLRHPLYFGSFLIAVGFCLLLESFTAAALAGTGYLALYLPVIRAEERLLAHLHGVAWASYCERSWAFLPRLRLDHRESAREPSGLLRPAWETGVILLTFLVALGGSELVRALRSSFDLPHLFP